jgi:hypothetical protein
MPELRKRNTGQFSFWQVYHIIAGREEVKGHGTRAMPIGGDRLPQKQGKEH